MNEPAGQGRSRTAGIEKLSPDLRPIVELELALGNEIHCVETEGWSRCPLAVSFERPLHFAEIAKRLQLPETVGRWENHDPHYSIEAGFACEKTRHAIAGPIGEELKT
jgi:hypothetical protein